MAHPDAPLKPQTKPHTDALVASARPSHRWWVAATVMLSSFLVPMSQSAMQVALPQMMTVFGLDLDQAQWIVTAYVIAGAMLVPAIGWLGNWLGNRTFYVVCLSLFVTNSALCALSWSGSSLITFRILQGLGGGPISPMTMMFLSNVFPAEQRGLAMGLFGMGQTSGPIMGTVIGGYLTEYLSWRMVFFLNVAPGVVCIMLVLLVLPNVREEVQQAFDLAGVLTMGVFLVSLLVALSRGQREGWDAPLIQRLFAVAGVALVSFIACELLAEEPLVDLRVYTNVTFAAVSALILLFFMTFTASTFLLVILMQRLLDYPPAQAGLAMVTTVLQRRLTYHSGVLDQQQISSALGWGEILAPVREVVRQAGAIGRLAETQVRTLLQGHLERQATVAAYQDCFMLVTLLCLASMPLVLLLRKR